jgi:hypothetical protein
MATQIGLLRITGTVFGICFYRMNGVYYARQKSSLSRKRVKKDPAFAATMRYAGLLGEAAKIASERYKLTVPKEERSRKKFREMVGLVMRELVEDEGITDKKDDSSSHVVLTAEAQNVGRVRLHVLATPARLLSFRLTRQKIRINGDS